MRCKQGAGFCRAAKWVADKQRQTRHFKVACIYQVGMMSESEKVEASFRPLSRELEKNSAGTTGSHLVSPYESRLSQYLPLEMQEYSAERVWDNTARKRDVRGKEICSPLEQPELDRPDREMGEDGEDTDEAGATETADYGLSARKGRKTADRIATRQTDLRTFCKQPFVDDAGDEPVMGGEKIDPFGILPDHLLAEVLVRVPEGDWPATACAQRRWAKLLRGDSFWKLALVKRWPQVDRGRRWPGPIGRGSSRRQYTALHVSETVFGAEDPNSDVYEVTGHVYLFLKEQLESATLPLSYSLLHGTIIDQFLACGKAGEVAHELASKVWLAVLDNLDESESTFRLLMRIAEEWEIFLPYPYSKSQAVQWKLFERLFTDFRDCLTQAGSISNVRPTYHSKTQRDIHEYALRPMSTTRSSWCSTSVRLYPHVPGPDNAAISPTPVE